MGAGRPRRRMARVPQKHRREPQPGRVLAFGRRSLHVPLQQGCAREEGEPRRGSQGDARGNRLGVREITLDLADNMSAIARKCFPNAIITLDRFHVQKDCNEAMQHLRVTLKNKARREDAKARRKHAKKLQRRTSRRKDPSTKDPRGRKCKRLNEQYVPERLENDDTRVELFTRCRYLLTVSADKWSESQRIRARILFREYPKLREAFSVCHSLRMIYNGKGTTRDVARASLARWYENALALKGVFDAVVETIRVRENDAAESLKSKINRFRAALHGVVDVNFFSFRLSKIFG